MRDWFYQLEGAINMSGKTRAIDEIGEAAKRNHFHQRNLLMLEAVISAMLDVHDHTGVAAILREHAEQLEDFG